MSVLWIQSEGGWGVIPLTDPRYSLRDAAGVKGVRRARRISSPLADPALLVRAAAMPASPWVLLAQLPAAANISVNALPILGVRLLADRDEIRVGRQRMFFSSDHPIASEPFSGPAGTCCALCGDPLVPGKTAVRCRCSLWFHQDADRACWSYADRCKNCSLSTALDSGFTWNPEGL